LTKNVEEYNLISVRYKPNWSLKMAKNAEKDNLVGIRDSVRGCLVGIAVGDALGMPSEGMTRQDILKNFGRIIGFCDSQSRFSRGLAKGQWTDDTKLTIATVGGLIESVKSNAFGNLYVVGLAMFVNYIQALEEHQKRGFGKTTRESLTARMEGNNPFDGRFPTRPGNGCAMKSAILGIFSDLGALFNKDFGEYDEEELVIMVSMLTHNDSRSVVGAMLQAHIAGLFLFGWDLRNEDNFSWIYEQAKYYEDLVIKIPYVKDGTPKISEILAKIPPLLGATDELIADVLKTGGAVYESFPTALAYAIKYQDDFRSAVLAGANAGGDTDTIAAMTGALVGTRVGLSGIPDEWKRELEDYENIVSLADKLVDAVRDLPDGE